MTNISDMIAEAVNTQPITFESLKYAIDKLNEKPTLPNDHTFCGVAEVKKCPALKGSETVVISGDKAYYWPDIFNLERVKVVKLPELPEPKLRFEWDFTTTENWEL